MEILHNIKNPWYHIRAKNLEGNGLAVMGYNGHHDR